MRLLGIEGLWGVLWCSSLVSVIGHGFAVIVYKCVFGDPAGQKAKVEAKGEGDIEKGLAGDARGNDDTRFCDGEEGGAQVDEKTPLKS
jgi:hypothetical protein